MIHPRVRPCLLVAFLAGAAGCTGGETGGPPSDAAAPGSGGSPAGASGGSVGSGGAPGVGGATGIGGNPGSGGATARPDAGVPDVAGGAGGRPGTGGVTGAGGRGTGGSGAGGSGTGGSGTGGAGGTSCTVPPPASTLVGWASLNGGTNGGGDLTPTPVSTTAAFNTAAGGTVARVIYVTGSLSGNFTVGSNKTIVGLCGALLQGHVQMTGSANVIFRNLTVVGNNCTDSPADCSAGADAITVVSNAHNIWFDHDDISDGSDGNLDVTNGSDFVTISWTKFHYSSMRSDPAAGATGHRFSNLIGAADTTTTDAGKLNVTFHHDWWADNVNQRMPRTRFGRIHVFNNLFTAAGNSYCTNAGIQAHVLVEGNVYSGVNMPLSPDANGDMLAPTGSNVFQNTRGTTTANGTGFVPTYPYTLDGTATLAATVMAQIGPH
jgi:pectate lyase